MTWLEPTVLVAVGYSEVMEGRLRDPVYGGLALQRGRCLLLAAVAIPSHLFLFP